MEGMELGRLALAYRSALRARMAESEAFAEWSMRPPSMGTLRVIHVSGPVSQREVGDRLGVDPSDMTRVVDKLEETGLVSRVRSEVDRRRYDLTLTTKGEGVLQAFLDVAHEVDLEFYEVLTPVERRVFNDLLAKLVEANGS